VSFIGKFYPPAFTTLPYWLGSDLKPENLLLDDAFRMKITDFGTGKLMDIGGKQNNLFLICLRCG